jgi:hypothetical protein
LLFTKIQAALYGGIIFAAVPVKVEFVTECVSVVT